MPQRPHPILVTWGKTWGSFLFILCFASDWTDGGEQVHPVPPAASSQGPGCCETLPETRQLVPRGLRCSHPGGGRLSWRGPSVGAHAEKVAWVPAVPRAEEGTQANALSPPEAVGGMLSGHNLPLSVFCRVATALFQCPPTTPLISRRFSEDQALPPAVLLDAHLTPSGIVYFLGAYVALRAFWGTPLTGSKVIVGCLWGFGLGRCTALPMRW